MQKVCVRVLVYNYIFGLFYQLIFAVHFFTPYSILWALFLCSCYVVIIFTFYHISLVPLYLTYKKARNADSYPKTTHC